MTFNRLHARIFSMGLALAGGVGCASLHLDLGGAAEAHAVTTRLAPMSSVKSVGEISLSEGQDAMANEDVAETQVEETAPAVNESRRFYPKWAAGTCANDGQSPYWGRLEYDDATTCCTKHFGLSYDACLSGAQTAAANAGNNALSTAPDGAAPKNTAAATMDFNGCPLGWTALARTCDDADGLALHCEDTLPSLRTPRCDDPDGVSSDVCIRSQGELRAEWCVKPTTAQLRPTTLNTPYGPHGEEG